MACGSIRMAFALGLALLAIGFAVSPATAANKTGVDVDVSGGYARLIFAVSDDVDASARVADNVLIVSFTKPTKIAVDRLIGQAPNYIAAARRDPDGMGLRFALARKVTVHSVTVDGKFFVDLLPDSWTGAPPGLPQELIDELARRAREADRRQRREHEAQQRKAASVRVRVASQPTFTRFVFDLPDSTSATAERGKDQLTLTFDAPIAFDLGDAEAALPAGVTAINSEAAAESSWVRFSLAGKIDTRTFRDGKSYVLDVDSAERSGESGRAAAQASEAGEDPTPGRARAARDSAAAKFEAAAPATAVDQPKPSSPPQAGPRPATAPGSAAPAAAAPPPATPPAAAAATPPAATPPPAASAQAPTAPPPSHAQPPAGLDKVEPPSPARVADSPSPAPAVAASGDAAPRAPSREGKAGDTVAAELSRQGADLKLSFAFPAPTAAAVFQRTDALWIVFDSKAAIDLSALADEASRTIRGSELIRTPEAEIVRIRLDRPHLASVATDGTAWTVTLGDTVAEPMHALEIARNLVGPNRSSVTVPFAEPHQSLRFDDPETGDKLFVVTAFPPARGFISEQDFVEFHVLASTHGMVVEPIADDISVELAPDKVMVSRPGGLALSPSLHSVLHGHGLRPVMFDSQLWGLDRESTYGERQSRLMAAAAAAPPSKRLLPRLDLARFYIARDMYPEAKGVLDVVLAEDRPPAEDVSPAVLRAVTELMMNRPGDALKDLASPAVGDQHEAPLWRALAYAGQGKWAQAREDFKTVEAAIATLPIELQRVALKDEMRAAIEVGDFASAADELSDFETIGVPRELQPALAVLVGRLSEGMGRSEDALASYRTAADSWDRPAAAQGRLREVALRYALGDLKREEVVSELETLTTVWRGDETEIEALQLLARLYRDQGRYRDSFYVMRSAMAARPDSDMTRRIQEEAAATFEALFLDGKGDTLPAVDALALFYDFRELTPIGRRGDEMIRRLADRLVSVDLLDQAADLLQYQVDQRLQGAARAQVAARLAVIYLMNRKADRALAALRATRTADVANELRDQRLLLEGRALSDLGRHDLALEVVTNVGGREAVRLRSDILWTARRWREAAEQIELLYGERWKEWRPLGDEERSDILRAAVGYALGEDALGSKRFREKYAAKMAATVDAHAFDIVSAQLGTNGAEFRDIAHAAASVDTLEGFLRDVQARYPNSSASPAPPKPAPPGAASGPPAEPSPATPPPPAPPPRASGRSAQR